MTDTTRKLDSREDYSEWRLDIRPDPALIEYLRTVPVAFISDCLKRIEIRNTQIRDVRGLSPLESWDGEHKSVVGPAITMEFAPHSEVRKYYEAPYKHTEIVEEAAAGDVIVISGHGAPYGFWGDHTTNQAINQGVAAVVIDGYLRDSAPIRRSGFPIYSTGTTFESYVRRYDPVGYNVPVTVGGAQVRPGDTIACDDDGALVIPQEVLERVVDVARDVERLEVNLEEAVSAGKPWEDIYREIHWRKYYAN